MPASLRADAVYHENLALTEAVRGNREAAHAAIDKAISLRPLSLDALGGARLLVSRAIVLTILGEHDEAVAQLQRLLQMPSTVSKNWLRLHPIFEPLRNNARFNALVRSP